MWQPKSIALKNFISHEETHYRYNRGSLDMICGINLDDSEEDKEESNGSGKSAMIEAECFAITGDNLRNVRVNDIIMNDKKETEVRLVLYNTLSKKELEIRRKSQVKGSPELVIIYDEEHESFSSVIDGNKRILEIIGITREDLLNYYIISKEKYNSFYYSSDTKKKDIVSRFSGADLIVGVDDLVKKDIDKIDNKVKEIEGINFVIEGKISALQEELEDFADRDFEQEKKDRINDIEIKIEDLSGENQEKESETKSINKVIDDFKEQKQELEDEKESIKPVDLSEELKKIEQKEKQIENNTLSLRKKEKQAVKHVDELICMEREINTHLSGVIECPECKFEFILKNEDIDIEEAREMLPEIKKEIEKSQEEIKKIRVNIDKQRIATNELDRDRRQLRLKESEYRMEVDKIDNTIYTFEKKIKTEEQKISLIDQEIESNEEKMIFYKKNIEDIKKEKIEDKSKAIKDKIKEQEKRLKEIEEDLEALGNEKFEIEQWIYNFQSFRSHLANEAIKGIEGFTNWYLEKIGSNLAIFMEGYKLLADGKTLREKITTHVLKDGIEEGAFGKLSGGEKAKVELCTILSLQSLINLSCKSGGFDLLSIDEILESVSSVGMEDIAGSFQDLDHTIKLITHVNMSKNFKDITTVVEKKDGVSKIIN